MQKSYFTPFKKSSFIFLFQLFCMSGAFVAPAMASDDKPDFSSEKLTGNWGGLRDTLFDKGVSLDVYYKADAWRNFSGGTSQGNRVMDNLDAIVTIDGAKAYGLEGSTVLVQMLSNAGGRINDIAGTNGGIDNIEAPNHAIKLYQAWVQQNFMDDRVSVLVGLHDLNSEFYVTDTSGLFLNPTYGIGTEMAVTGDNGPSIFPATSLAARLAIKPTDNTYLMGAVYDGVPGSVNNPRGTHIQFKDNEGALLVAEGGMKDDNYGHFGVGVWEYTAQRDDQENSAVKRHSKGIYFLADKSVYKEGDKDISAFGRVGFTAGDVEQFKNKISIGSVLSGFIPSRPEGQIGFAATVNSNSDKYKRVNTPKDAHENQFELTYSDKITPWLSIQPDVQYTINPGTDPSLKNAWTAGVRLGIDF